MSEKAKGRRGKRLKKNVVLEDDEAPQQESTQTTNSKLSTPGSNPPAATGHTPLEALTQNTQQVEASELNNAELQLPDKVSTPLNTKALTDHTAALDYQPTSVPFSYTGHQEQFSYNGHQSPAPPSYSPVVIEEEDEDEIEDLTNNHADDPLYFDITGQGNRTVDAQPKSISDYINGYQTSEDEHKRLHHTFSNLSHELLSSQKTTPTKAPQITDSRSVMPNHYANYKATLPSPQAVVRPLPSYPPSLPRPMPVQQQAAMQGIAQVRPPQGITQVKPPQGIVQVKPPQGIAQLKSPQAKPTPAIAQPKPPQVLMQANALPAKMPAKPAQTPTKPTYAPAKPTPGYPATNIMPSAAFSKPAYQYSPAKPPSTERVQAKPVPVTAFSKPGVGKTAASTTYNTFGLQGLGSQGSTSAALSNNKFGSTIMGSVNNITAASNEKPATQYKRHAIEVFSVEDPTPATEISSHYFNLSQQAKLQPEQPAEDYDPVLTAWQVEPLSNEMATQQSEAIARKEQDAVYASYYAQDQQEYAMVPAIDGIALPPGYENTGAPELVEATTEAEQAIQLIAQEGHFTMRQAIEHIDGTPKSPIVVQVLAVKVPDQSAFEGVPNKKIPPITISVADYTAAARATLFIRKLPTVIYVGAWLKVTRWQNGPVHDSTKTKYNGYYKIHDKELNFTDAVMNLVDTPPPIQLFPVSIAWCLPLYGRFNTLLLLDAPIGPLQTRLVNDKHIPIVEVFAMDTNGIYIKIVFWEQYAVEVAKMTPQINAIINKNINSQAFLLLNWVQAIVYQREIQLQVTDKLSVYDTFPLIDEVAFNFILYEIADSYNTIRAQWNALRNSAAEVMLPRF